MTLFLLLVLPALYIPLLRLLLLLVLLSLLQLEDVTGFVVVSNQVIELQQQRNFVSRISCCQSKKKIFSGTIVSTTISTTTKKRFFHSNTVIVSFPKKTHLFGLWDEINSGAYDITKSTSSSPKKDAVNMNNAYEMFLAELVFSTNDPRVDIFNKLDLATDRSFLAWLESKIQNSKDPDERVALGDLLEMILDVQNKVEVNKLAEERKKKEAESITDSNDDTNSPTTGSTEQDERTTDESNRVSSPADILRIATQIQTTQSEKSNKEQKFTFYDQEVTPEIRLSYEKLLKKALPPYKAGDNPTTIAFKLYDQFDAQFMKLLSERSVNGDKDAKSLLEAIAELQRQRVEAATASLKKVLSAGEPMKMEGEIVKLAREGKVDESFLLLLEANRDQALNAGAKGPATLMDRLRLRAIDEKDKQMNSKEIRLLRKLLRTDDSKAREALMEEAFTPRQSLIVAGTAANARKAMEGDMPDQDQPMPDVPPPEFLNACKAVLLNFGNLGSDDDNSKGNLATRIRKLAAEAEVVATRIYGKGMTVREQQDRTWSELTTSIWDLERLEIEAERSGEAAPWANPNQDDIFMPGFDKDGRMQVGGS